MKYILIKDNKINNIIVADETFIDVIKNDYDLILNHDDYSSKPNLIIGASVIKNLDDSIDFFLPYVEPEENIIDAEEVTPTPALEG